MELKYKILLKLQRNENPVDVGIISFNINSATYNFGAALHSYAFQQFLNKLGIQNVIINYYAKTTKYNFITQKIIQNFKDKQFLTLTKNLFYGFFILIKKIKFENFFKKHCITTKHRYELHTLWQLNSINRYVTETDITWAKFQIGKYDKAFFCDLPHMKNKDNVAYSVDFGYGQINDQHAGKLKEYSKNFKYISIRNILKLESFKNFLQNEDIEVTIDPVFLLDANDYKKIMKKSKKCKPYVLVYNCADNNEEMREQAKKFAEEKNLQVKTINSYTRNINDFMDSIPTPIGIEEFLENFYNAQYIFTNSYHGLCFSIIFQKQFFAYTRIFETEKLHSLLKMFNLEERFIETNITNLQEIDYEKTNLLINEWRKKSIKFIEKSLVENKE